MENTNKQPLTAAEEKILTAAQTIFIKKGFDGARMQEIADEAQVNKAMIHYYFRNKENLFKAIFHRTMGALFPVLIDIMNADKPFFDKIHELYEKYLEFLIQNPELPVFLLSEAHKNTPLVKEVFEEYNPIVKGRIVSQISDLAANGHIARIHPAHFIMNLLSLAIFPFLGKPILQAMFHFTDDQFMQLMNDRKAILPEFLIQAIKPTSHE